MHGSGSYVRAMYEWLASRRILEAEKPKSKAATTPPERSDLFFFSP